MDNHLISETVSQLGNNLKVMSTTVNIKLLFAGEAAAA